MQMQRSIQLLTDDVAPLHVCGEAPKDEARCFRWTFYSHAEHQRTFMTTMMMCSFGGASDIMLTLVSDAQECSNKLSWTILVPAKGSIDVWA